MKTTIEDIARASGVSKATVSYVLNRKRSSLGLSAQTINKVLNVSRKLKYRPDLVAVALSEQKNIPLSILLLSPWLHSQFSDFMAQVSHALEYMASGVRLKLAYELYHVNDLRKILRSAKCAKFDAVIVLGSTHEDNAFLRKNCENFKNVVMLNREIEGYPCSYGNDYEVCAEMARRIVSRGYYQKYVIASGAMPTHCEEKRIGGFQSALKKVSGNVSAFEFEDELSLEEQIVTLYESFGSQKKVLYFIPQYHPAAFLMQFLRQKGINVPEEAGIACYDSHSLLTDFISPALTTVDPNIVEMTKQALALAQGIKNGKIPRSVVTKGIFVPGGSAIF